MAQYYDEVARKEWAIASARGDLGFVPNFAAASLNADHLDAVGLCPPPPVLGCIALVCGVRRAPSTTWSNRVLRLPTVQRKCPQHRSRQQACGLVMAGPRPVHARCLQGPPATKAAAGALSRPVGASAAIAAARGTAAVGTSVSVPGPLPPLLPALVMCMLAGVLGECMLGRGLNQTPRGTP